MHSMKHHYRFVRQFGQGNRYILTKMYDRERILCWFVTDTTKTNEATGLYEIIRQSTSEEEAVKGLE